MKHKTFVLMFGALFLSGTSAAQLNISIGQANLHAGKIGLGLDGITGSNDFLLKYFFSNQVAGQAIVGFAIDAPGGTAAPGVTKVNGTTIRLGLGVVVHLTQDQVTPYVGAEVLYQSETQAGFYVRVPDAKNNIFLSGVFGAEYFPAEKFSVGIKQSIGADFGLKRDIPEEESDVKLNTSTVFTGRYYFN